MIRKAMTTIPFARVKQNLAWLEEVLFRDLILSV